MEELSVLTFPGSFVRGTTVDASQLVRMALEIWLKVRNEN